MCLAVGLRPDLLGELERSPRLPSRNWWCLREKGRNGIGRGNGGREGEDREGRGLESHTILGS